MTGPALRPADAAAPADPPDRALFGFWMFMMSDAVIFALLLAIYGTMVSATAGGPSPAQEFDLAATFAETALLLTSSLTFGMAMLSMEHGGGRAAILGWLAATLALGAAFLGLEWRDFAGMLAHGAHPARSGFLSAFFALVGLHGLHVLAGCLWLLAAAGQALAHGLDARTRINLRRLSLFWHFLGIVWIAVFSVVHLQGLIR